MDFYAVLARVIDLLEREQRVSYRALKRQFGLDDDYIEDLKDELIKAKRLAVDEDGAVLVWTGDATQEPTPHAGQTEQPAKDQERAPTSYTPQHLAEKILTSRRALEGERKQVTVMFADIKDSTELIRDLDPEAAQQLLDPAIHIMMDAVHRFEGTVNQVLGDGIMALFGAPIAHEDHAARACYAALAMQSAMQPYADEVRRTHGITIRIRVGLNSGEVVVRTIGNDLHMDYSAVGQTTNLASRMEQLAAPGSVVLTAATLRLVEGLVRVDDLGPVPVKGISEPVAVYELKGASTIRRRLQAAVARGLTKFVGRDTEIEVLNQAREQAEAGYGQIVAAVGEAGVGKSRLVYEFIHSHRTQGWLVLESASVSYGKATPYFPIIDLLKRYVHVDDGDDSRTIRAKVTGQILTLDESLREAIPALLSLLNALPENSPFLQLDPPQRRQRTLDGLKRILLRESQEQPLALVFEDLHWIDSETQALLNSLVDSLPTAQLLLLVNYRPEYQHRWGSKTYYTQLRLDPLPPASADAFLAAVLGDDSNLEPMKKLLIERTEGNPFFLEESVRTLVETKVLEGAPGAYRLARELSTIQVPATVQAILAARIDRLPQEEKRLLQTASVIGTEVPLSLLQAIADVPEDVLRLDLTHLQEAEFLYETSLYPEQVYMFKHALTHEVAYGSLLHERRRALHAQIVVALEQHDTDRLTERVDQLAHHALRGEIWDKAVLYYRQAGTQGVARSAYREAKTCFQQALTALRQLPENRRMYEEGVDLWLALRSTSHPLGESWQDFNHLSEAERFAIALDDPYQLGRVYTSLAACYWWIGDYERVDTYSKQVITIAETLGDVALQLPAQYALGLSHFYQGSYDLALDCFRFVIATYGDDMSTGYYAAGGASLLTFAHAALSLPHAECGTFTEGLRHSREVSRLADMADNLYSRILGHTFVGFLYLRKGALDEAISILESGLELCRSGNIPRFVPDIACWLGNALTLSDRLSEAVPVLEDAVQQGDAMRFMVGQALRVAHLSEAYGRVGRVDEALQQAQRALELSRQHKELGHEAYVLRLLGDIAVHADSPDLGHAQTLYHQALALANELDMRPLQAHCHCGLGTLYRQAGQPEQARTELSTAIEMYRDMEMTFWLPETEAALADMEGKP